MEAYGNVYTIRDLLTTLSDLGFKLYDSLIKAWSWLTTPQKLLASPLWKLLDKFFGLVDPGYDPMEFPLAVPGVVFRPIDLLLWIFTWGFMLFVIIKAIAQ